MNCTEGHPIPVGQQQCPEGHDAQQPDIQVQTTAHLTEIQQLISLIQSQNLIQQQQMDRMTRMEAENQTLRDALLQSQVKPRTKRHERPIIEVDSSDNTWEVFLDSWKIYKRMSNISDQDISIIRDELRSACSKEVNQLLFNFVGQASLESANETTLLGYIKSVAVRGMHTEVHRHHFFKMTQTEGETITHFVARLRSQALLCQFSVAATIPCPCPTPEHCPRQCPATSPISYMDEMISSQMVSGLQNAEHQNRILAEAASLTTFKAKFDMLVSLEMTDKATPLLSHHQNSLVTPSSSAATKSEYKRQKRLKNDEKGKETPSKCRGCGKGCPTRKSCPANGQKCRGCKRIGHFQSVCEQSGKSQANAAPVEPTDTASLSSASFLFAQESSQEPAF